MTRSPGFGFVSLIALLLASVAAAAPTGAAEEPRPAPLRIRGRVLATDSRSAPKGARVELHPAVETYDAAVLRLTRGEEAPPIASARPSADGTFELTAPESGLYRVVVRADRAASMEYPLLPLTEDADLAPVQMIPGSPTPAQLLGAGGRPLAGADVRTTSPEFPPGWSFGGWRRTEESVRTGEDGKAVLQAVHYEGLNLYAIHPGFLGLASAARQERGLPDRVEVLARPARSIEVRDAEGRPVAGALVRWRSWPVGVTGQDGRLRTVLPGPEEPPLTIEGPSGERGQVPHAAASGNQPLVVRLGRPEVVAGRVVDAASKAPVAGALVWASPSSPPVRTDAAGRFRLTLPRREARLEAVAPGYLRSERQPVPRAGAEAVLSLRPAAALEGRVEDSQGNPVSWAYLSIPEPGQPRSRRGTGNAWSRADGRFRLPGLLPRGSYEITASREGFLNATVQARTPLAGRPSAPVKIVLGAGQTAFGRIVDEAGQPVAEAFLILGNGGPVEMAEAFEVVSDAEGRFEIRGIPLGLYALFVDHPGFAPFERPEIKIASGPPADLGTITLQPGAVIEGRVTNRRGAPVEGAEARVGYFPHMPLRSMPPATRTGRDGRFRLGGLRPGARYDLEIGHPDHPRVKVPGVEAPTTEPVVIELSVARRIAGRVVGPAGEPVPNASLSSVQEREIGFGGHGFSTSRSVESIGHTDLRGEFRTDSLPPGTFDLEVSAPGYQSREVKGLTLPEDRDLEGIEIVLDRQALLAGRVLTSAGEPLADVQIHAFPNARHEKRRQLLRENSSSTDAAGSYRIALPPGSYTIAAFAQGQRVERSQIVQPGSNHLDMVIPDGQEVSGRVIDEAGDPVGGASISLQNGASTWSEADGSFTMRGVGDGTHRLTANREGFGRAAAEVVVAGGPVSGVELQLSPRGSGTLLSGRLLGLPPENLREARVRAWGGSGHGTVQIDPDGVYRIPDLSPGEWRVTAHAGILQAEGKVQIEPGTPEAVLDLEFPASKRLTGRILVDGQPLRGAGLTPLVQKGASGGHHRTGYDGTFTIPNLPVNASGLLIQQSERGFGTIVPLSLTEDREILLDIATGTLRGQVIAGTGEPVADAAILVRGIHEALGFTFSGPTGRTGEAGDFEIRSLAPGTYEVEIQKGGATLSKTRAVVTSGGNTEVEVQLVH